MEVTITSENFETLKNGTTPLVVDFWAEWCSPCKMISPIVSQLAEEYDGKIIVGKCNVEEAEDVAAMLGIRNIPTLIFFKNGQDNIQTSSPHDAPQNGYLARKSLNVLDDYKTGAVTDRQGFTYRLAFTYLDYAEAVNKAYDDAAKRLDALKYLNRIRERAGVRKYTFDAVPVNDPNYITIPNTQADLHKYIMMERRVELCCENNRWYDIRRYMLAESIPEMTGACYSMNFQGANAANFYKATVADTRVWRKQFYWMPIYIDEYEKNPNLREAPFWVIETAEKESGSSEDGESGE